MEPLPLNDENWLKNFREGDEESLKALFALCGAPLFYFAKSMIGNKEIAGEIVSASFVRTWHGRSDLLTLETIKNDLYRDADPGGDRWDTGDGINIQVVPMS